MEETREEQINKEYMIQHFSTDPSFLIEDVCEDFKDCVASSLLGIKDVLKKKQSDSFDEAELVRKMDLLQNDYQAYFEKKCVTLSKALKHNIFKVPQNVLLKEDLPWQNISNQEAKEKKIELTIEMEKQRNEYKTAKFKKTYLRSYLEKLKEAAAYQEELIQRETSLKEKCGIEDTLETLNHLQREWNSSRQKLDKLRTLKDQVDKTCTTYENRKRKNNSDIKVSNFPTEKKTQVS